MMPDQATLARSDEVYLGQMVSAQARYMRAVEGGAGFGELADLQEAVRRADAIYRRWRAAISDEELARLQRLRAEGERRSRRRAALTW